MGLDCTKPVNLLLLTLTELYKWVYIKQYLKWLPPLFVKMLGKTGKVKMLLNL